MSAASELHEQIILPGLDLLQSLGGPARAPAPERLLLAIAGQETAWVERVQRSKGRDGAWISGPARGFWQFERGGGVRGVLSHPRTVKLAYSLCSSRLVAPTATDVHLRLAKDDLLACGFARLLLLTDPAPIPEDQAGAWACYLRNWRPGKPDASRWPACWKEARAVVDGPDAP